MPHYLCKHIMSICLTLLVTVSAACSLFFFKWLFLGPNIFSLTLLFYILVCHLFDSCFPSYGLFSLYKYRHPELGRMKDFIHFFLNWLALECICFFFLLKDTSCWWAGQAVSSIISWLLWILSLGQGFVLVLVFFCILLLSFCMVDLLAFLCITVPPKSWLFPDKSSYASHQFDDRVLI